MNEQLVANTFLYLTNTFVFGVLSFLLWQFYRGFGSKHVKLWQFSLQALTTSQLVMCVKAYTSLSSPTSVSQVLLEGLYQSSYFVFVSLFLIGLYIAQTHKLVARKHIFSIVGASFSFAWLVTLVYAFADGHVYDRFFLRETLPQFLLGVAYIGMAFFIYRTPPAHVSSRIMQISFVIYGLRYFIFSMLSTVMIAEVWFSQVIRFFSFFDIGSHVVIGFSMLMWMQGAERAAAKSATSKAQYLGQHDPLTGSLNREQVMEKMPKLMRETSEKGKKLSIFLLDIKRFKFVNDTYGLKTGDYILGEIARRLRDSLFQPKIVGRLSGDSFVYVFEFEQHQQISRALSHLHELIARPYLHDGQDIMLQCSIGYSFYPEHTQSAETLLQLSNLALFHAESRNEASKQYSHDMQVQGRHLLAMEKAIKLAMKQDEFELYFQPQLNLLTNKLEGVEALIRWNHPNDGLLAPNRFLPDIDALAMNSVFDNHVLEKACCAIARWHQTYRRWVTVAVNITAVEFQDPKFVSKIQTLLLKHDVPPNYLELEITENMVMTDLQSAMDTIIELQTMGIKVSIDDFGTGYSSLAYLRNLPIDKIKIDRSFVNEMAENDSDLTIVKSMVRLSHGLGKRVLAEGVETQTQLEILRTLNCDAVQGYYISKPICETELVKYFKR